uniref:FERM domain containing protein n=1 Tax=Dicyema japonicum TaxID=399803 RepID=B9ZYW3_DICJA|nr:FERM domain containing protein [Dicyema japonicum]
MVGNNFSLLRRLISGRGRRDHVTSSAEPRKPKKGFLICRIAFLDGTEICFEQRKKCIGSDLLELAFYHLDLLEKDYFGLQFVDMDHVKKWLDPMKSLTQQCKGKGRTVHFNFLVKFYPSEPNKMKEECTRYHMYLQLKSDLFTGKLDCKEDVAVDLSALILQSELGDFNRNSHTRTMISEFRFVPNQTEQFERQVYEVYQTYRGLTTEHAELAFLNKCKYLDMYGVDLHSVIGCDENTYSLGLTPSGILIFEGQEKIGLFFWPTIKRLDFRSHKLILVLIDSHDGVKTELKFVFRTAQVSACKQLWKSAIEHHAFYRLRSTSDFRKSFTLRLGSRFRYSGRTEFQAGTESSPRRSVHFVRRPSRRYPRREVPDDFTWNSTLSMENSRDSKPNETMRSSQSDYNNRAKAAIRALDDILQHVD